MDIGYGGYNNVLYPDNWPVVSLRGIPFLRFPGLPHLGGQFASSGGCVTTILGANTGVLISGPSSSDLPIVHDVGPAGNRRPIPRYDEDGLARHRAHRQP